MPLRIKGTVGTREVLYLKSDNTGRCQVAGWEFLRGTAEAGAEFVLPDGLSL